MYLKACLWSIELCEGTLKNETLAGAARNSVFLKCLASIFTHDNSPRVREFHKEVPLLGSTLGMHLCLELPGSSDTTLHKTHTSWFGTSTTKLESSPSWVVALDGFMLATRHHHKHASLGNR
jgi:hypothetical protein